MKTPVKKKNYEAPSLDETAKRLNAMFGFNVGNNGKPVKRSDLVGSSADKPLKFIPMKKAFSDATKLPGIPMGYVTMCGGWSDTGKSTIKNELIASCINNNILPVIFETEGNFDWQYAIDCGVKAVPVYDEIIDEDTGEVIYGIAGWDGPFIFFDRKGLLKNFGKWDYKTGKETSKMRTQAVIEDIAKAINFILDQQAEGAIKQPICFIWDSIGSIPSFASVVGVKNNMYDAGAISTVFNDLINGRIPQSRNVSEPYTNTMFCVNKIWNDSMNSMGGIPSIEYKGGKTFFYGARLILHLGGVAKAATKKLNATAKGQTYRYGIITKIKVVKNQLPTPYNITYEGEMACVHNGLLEPDKLDDYKKNNMKDILKHIEELAAGSEVDIGDIKDEDVKFTENSQED